MSHLISIKELSSTDVLEDTFTSPLYSIFLFAQGGHFAVDGTAYRTDKNTVLFLTPYQSLQWFRQPKVCRQVSFHGDFYCIEYHKYEVACNGLLFNNAYLTPYVEVSDALLRHLHQLAEYIRTEQQVDRAEILHFGTVSFILQGRGQSRFRHGAECFLSRAGVYSVRPQKVKGHYGFVTYLCGLIIVNTFVGIVAV